MLDIFKSKTHKNRNIKYDKSEDEEMKEVIEKETSKVIEEAKATYKHFLDLDEQAYEFYKDFHPEIKKEVLGDRIFLTLADVEFCVNFVATIEVGWLGQPPAMVRNWDSSSYRNNVYSVEIKEATPACVLITYGSGKAIPLYCNRHCIDAVYQALTKEYRKALKEV